LAGIPSTAPHGLFEPTSRVCNPEASKRSTLGKRRTSPVIRQQGKAACSFRMSERICKQDLSGCSSCCGCDARLRTCERGTQEPFLWLGSIVKKARDDDARGTRRVYIEREREKKRMPDQHQKLTYGMQRGHAPATAAGSGYAS
jgi:hypothetical protein